MGIAVHIAGKDKPSRAARKVVFCIDQLEPRRLLSVSFAATTTVNTAAGLAPTQDSAPNIQGLTPDQIRQTYGFNQVTFSNQSILGDGSGQTLAIVEAYDDKNIIEDLQAFDEQFGLVDPPTLSRIDQTGGTHLPSSNPAWSRETALDVEWAHAIAPAANIVLVEAKSDRLSDLLIAVDTARHLSGVSVVSMSWGTSEFPSEVTLDDVFTTPANHDGVTFVASSGDLSVSSGVQWPSSSPNVLAVGGTTLYVRSANNATGIELPWSGSIGGVSSFEPRPGYQSPIASTGRVIPDVAYNADPLTGYAVFDSVPFNGDSGWQIVGGTSAAAPQWAALVTIANQGRALNGLPSLDGPGDTLPALYQFYGSATSVNMTANGATDAAPPSQADSPAAPPAPGTLINSAGETVTSKVIGALTITKPAELPPAPTPANFGAGSHAPDRPVNIFAIPRVNVTRAAPSMMGVRALSQSILALPSLIGVSSETFVRPLNHLAMPAAIATVPASARPRLGLADEWMAAHQAIEELMGRMEAMLTAAPPSVLAPAVMGQLEFPVAGLARLHVPHLNITARFSDRVWGFIAESAAMELPQGAATQRSFHISHFRAWAITVSVLAFDSVLLGYAYRRRMRYKISNVL